MMVMPHSIKAFANMIVIYNRLVASSARKFIEIGVDELPSDIAHLLFIEAFD